MVCLHDTAYGSMVAKPVTVGVVGVIVLASALVLNYFVLPGEESETATAVTAPPPPAATAPKADAGPQRTTAPPSSRAASPGPDAAAAAARSVPPKPPVSSEPSFDVVRVDPDGNAVLAGRGAPNAEIAIMDGGEEIGRVTTDSRGEWVFIPPSKLPPGQRVLFLRQAGAGPTASTGEVSDSVVLVIPEKGKDIAGRPASEPSLPLVMVVPKEDPGDGGTVVARVLQAPAAGPLASPAAPTDRAAAPAGPAATSGATAAGDSASASAGSASTGSASTGAESAGSASAGSASTGSASTASVPTASGSGGAVAAAAPAPAPAASAAASGAARTAAGSEGARVTPPGAALPGAGAGVPVAATLPVVAEPSRPAAAAEPSAEPSAAPSSAHPGAPASERAAGAIAAAGGRGAAPVVSAYPETAAGSAPQAGSGASDVAVDVIDYDDKGEVVFSGRSDPGARVEVYIDDKSVGGAGADAAGRWTMRPEAPVAPGSYQLRVDKVAAGGTVEARVAFPFVRANPLTELPNNRLVVIQPGNNLWRIATRVYGSGVRYVEIFDANKDQILNPDLIYPGQVFGLPRTN